jgi:hypothetical protein
VVRSLHVGDALGVVLRAMAEDAVMPDDLVDANYVRGEQEIYKKAAPSL